MKLISTIFTLTALLLTNTCNTKIQQDPIMEITGTIEAIEMTSWQYGTHTIHNDDDEFYALRSEKVDLEDYEGQRVTIKAKIIEGYPVDGGPEYLEVEEIKN